MKKTNSRLFTKALNYTLMLLVAIQTAVVLYSTNMYTSIYVTQYIGPGSAYSYVDSDAYNEEGFIESSDLFNQVRENLNQSMLRSFILLGVLLALLVIINYKNRKVLGRILLFTAVVSTLFLLSFSTRTTFDDMVSDASYELAEERNMKLIEKHGIE